MMPLPRSRKDARDADEARIGKAFAAYTGGPQDGASPQAEQEEDQAYTEIQDLLGQLDKIVSRLRELHQTPEEQQPHEEAGTPDTGSPSAQGSV